MPDLKPVEHIDTDQIDAEVHTKVMGHAEAKGLVYNYATDDAACRRVINRLLSKAVAVRFDLMVMDEGKEGFAAMLESPETRVVVVRHSFNLALCEAAIHFAETKGGREWLDWN